MAAINGTLPPNGNNTHFLWDIYHSIEDIVSIACSILFTCHPISSETGGGDVDERDSVENRVLDQKITKDQLQLLFEKVSDDRRIISRQELEKDISCLPKEMRDDLMEATKTETIAECAAALNLAFFKAYLEAELS